MTPHAASETFGAGLSRRALVQTDQGAAIAALPDLARRARERGDDGYPPLPVVRQALAEQQIQMADDILEFARRSEGESARAAGELRLAAEQTVAKAGYEQEEGGETHRPDRERG